MRSRLKAFTIHLLISILIAIAVMALVFGLWYPAPLATATGVTSIFLILLLVDVILGPSLTLLVYKSGKKTLVMDLTLVVFLQLSALSYGIYTVAEGRPAWLVFSVDLFELVRINEIDDRAINEASNEYKTPSWFGPQWVVAIPPNDINSRNNILFESLFAGVDIAQRPNLYQSLDNHAESISSRIISLEKLNSTNQPEQVQKQLERYPQADGWLPLSANNQDMVVLMQREHAKVIAIINLRPW